ncbi:AMP-binding protein [Bacillus timonensis]|nr:AMP-binding protein [Bacillus timonensis]
MNKHVVDGLKHWAETTPDAPALVSLEGSSVSYRELWENVRHMAGRLVDLGVERGERVAVVLGDGPEMATVFLSVACFTTCAPLNPKYTREELLFYFEDTRAAAVVVENDGITPAIQAANELGMKVITLEQLEVSSETEVTLANDEDVALVLHTSGTTARPKIVPIRQRHVCASMVSISRSLKLTENDRCLLVMPLFHVHGLIGGLLSTLNSGGSVICSRGFQVDAFYQALTELSPTWYTAVPTMHHTIVTHGRDGGSPPSHGLRFIRSCSSSLPPLLAQEVEAFFQVPIVEAYGMTEAAHQMAVNPLPPGERKHGSVGKAEGCGVAIMDDACTLLPYGSLGEIVVRGDNVIDGYEHNPDANEKSFTNGWFRTGDQGYIDHDGYIFIDGRIKEIINRGGEKVSPREVDEVLLRHHAVAQVACFAVPHPTLGEEVGAIVVLKPGAYVTERELRAFAVKSVTPYKVPTKIVFASEIPKGPTGKVQRVGLAKKLGLDATVMASVDLDVMATIWRKSLRVNDLSFDDDFFELGGSSIQAYEILSVVQETFGVEVSFPDFFGCSTIRELASFVSKKQEQARTP